MEGTKFRKRGIKLQKELGYLKRKNENNFFFKNYLFGHCDKQVMCIVNSDYPKMSSL